MFHVLSMAICYKPGSNYCSVWMKIHPNLFTREHYGENNIQKYLEQVASQEVNIYSKTRNCPPVICKKIPNVKINWLEMLSVVQRITNLLFYESHWCVKRTDCKWRIQATVCGSCGSTTHGSLWWFSDLIP